MATHVRGEMARTGYLERFGAKSFRSVTILNMQGARIKWANKLQISRDRRQERV